MTEKRLKVLVALSGGVDSSVAALLMKRKGYDVVAAFMKNWSDSKNDLGECNWREERRMASKIAAKLDIPLITLDYEKQYKKEVVDEMFEQYKKGITPNPDVDCNQKIKFPNLIKEAEKLGCDFVVTGHYARIKKVKKLSPLRRAGGWGSAAGKEPNAKYKMLRARDETKDQSYFLYRINQKELSKTLFPIGEFTKNQTREIAKRAGFPNFNKKSTVGICFIGKINLKDFLSKKIKPKKGNIINPRGEIIGQHDGIYYYTIGQRLGPRYGFDLDKNSDDKHNLNRWYVARKDAKKNLIVAAPEGHPLLYRQNILISDPHWISGKPPIKSFKRKSVYSRIRQVGELIPSKLSYDKEKKKFQIKLKRAITGVSEGQAIVLYKGKEVLGGGVIGF